LIPLQKLISMKKLVLVLLVFIVPGCKSTSINKVLDTLDETYTTEISNCITNATCSIEIIPNSSLLIKQDEFQNSYVEIKKGSNTLVKYQLKKNEIPNTADSNYSEILYIEIDNYNKSLVLKNEELQQVKMIYGRLCYCKGASGYFKVKKGNLELILKKNQLTLNTNFTVENIPQIITQVREKITLQN